MANDIFLPAYDPEQQARDAQTQPNTSDLGRRLGPLDIPDPSIGEQATNPQELAQSSVWTTGPSQPITTPQELAQASTQAQSAPTSAAAPTGQDQGITLHPNGAPTEPPQAQYWTYEQAQRAGTFNPDFGARLRRMVADSHGKLVITSGFRDNAKQTSLYNVAVQEHGAANADQWVAHPHDANHQGSNHERGEAADISGDLNWAHNNAARYGLAFPMSWEPWHIEPVGLRKQTNADAYTTVAGNQNPTVDPNLDSSAAETTATVSNLFTGNVFGSGRAGGGAESLAAATSGGTGSADQVGAGSTGVQSLASASGGGLGSEQQVGAGGAGNYNTPNVSLASTRSGSFGPVTLTSATTGGAGNIDYTASNVSPQAASPSQQDYINLVTPYAKAEEKRTGIPWQVMVVQSGVETGWGTSGWWTNNRNPAGIGVTGEAGKGFSYANVGDAFHDYANRLMGNGEAGMEKFVKDVKAGASVEQLLVDIEMSPWAGGHYNGNGLTQTYAALNGGGAFTQAEAAQPKPAAPAPAAPAPHPMPRGEAPAPPYTGAAAPGLPANTRRNRAF